MRTMHLAIVLAAASCGGGHAAPPDAPADAARADANVDARPDANVDADVGPWNGGFTPPTVTTTAYANDVLIGAADWSCLGTASTDVATTKPITLTGTARDFQNQNAVPGAKVTLFPGTDPAGAVATATASGTGAFSLAMPAGHARWGVAIAAASYAETRVLNLAFDPSTTPQTRDLVAISTGLASALPAFLDVDTTPSAALILARVHDCAGHDVSGAITTVSVTAGVADHAPRSNSYYFNASVKLPAKHSSRPATDTDGLSVIFNTSAAPTLYLQAWGYPTDGELAKHELVLLAELPARIDAGIAVVTDLEPRRAP